MTEWAPAPQPEEHEEGNDEQVHQATSRKAGSTRKASSGKAEEKAGDTIECGTTRWWSDRSPSEGATQ